MRKIERGRLGAPQNPGVLHRLCRAVACEPDDPRAQELRYLAAVQTGSIPHELIGDEEAAARLRLLLRMVRERRVNSAELNRLIATIREA